MTSRIKIPSIEEIRKARAACGRAVTGALTFEMVGPNGGSLNIMGRTKNLKVCVVEVRAALKWIWHKHYGEQDPPAGWSFRFHRFSPENPCNPPPPA